MKKNLALLLIVCMILPLAACGGTAEPAEGTGTSEAGEETQASLSTIEAINLATTIPEGETYDLDAKLPLVKEGEDNKLSIGIRVSANTTDYKDNDYTRWLEEKTGIDFEFVQFAGTNADTATQVALMTAAGEKLPDILFWFSGINKAQGEQYGRDGYFRDLSEYYKDPDMNYYRRWGLKISFPDDPTANEMLMRRGTDSETGAIYSYPYFENCPEDRPRNHVSINKLWLENLGLKMPTTVDELYDVLVAFRDQDPNGNGVKDEIPMLCRPSNTYSDVLHWIMNAFLFVNDSYFFNVEDGKLYLPYDQDEYRQALIFIKKLVDEGLLSSQSWTISGEEYKNLLNPVDGVYTVGVCGANVYSDFLATGHSMQDYQQVPWLKDETGKGGYGPMASYGMYYTTYITEDCENPELAFRFMDFLCAPENHMHLRWGVEGRDWEYVDPALGLTGTLGGTATVRMLSDNDPQTYPNNITWHAYGGISCSLTHQQAVDLDDPDSFITARYYHDTDCIRYCEEAGLPDEVFYFNVYTVEEKERRDEFTTDIQSYISTARADFCNGIANPESDADWQAYLDNLDRLNKAEWISIGQTAYDRTFKNS